MLAVMGPSGSGKSTLLQLAGGLTRPTSGRVVLCGSELGTLGEAGLSLVLRRRVGFVFQDINLLAALTAAENVSLPLELDGMRPRSAMATARALLSSLGLDDVANRLPAQMSGGQQQRVAVARAVIGGRSLLLADEPTGALDSLSGESVMQLLRAQSDDGCAVVLVTHDVRHAAWADRILCLRDGRLIDEVHPPAGPESLLRKGARVMGSPGTGAPLIVLAGVEKTYYSGRVAFRALRGIDLEIRAGEMVAIVGPSGSGKTTIVNLIAGIDRPSAGTVTVNGTRLDLLGEEQLAIWRRANIGMVFQFFQLMPTLSALDNTLLPMELARHGSRRTREAQARALLSSVGLTSRGSRLPVELSGGEQQRVALARAMACRPRILIGDEPTGNLDSETAGEMFGLLADLNAAGTTVIFVTHDPGLAALAPRLVTMRDGRIVSDTSGVAPGVASPGAPVGDESQ